ncbi:TylF/MycF family methyltransferase [Sphingobium sp. PNB]|uniref:TylF/MycF/NovP-related O-methyltransferase n=1 Tax=Sphingobium sp. PNB TaxID=863934 RepID=UPI001CA44DD7|nr:TylF/MycF/NovP-related O-methyltransferase [Sphingobium sp. PNB]MCB4862596.1 TylF/MycF family methyltransferase [Sphingobium sp. PNB]
MKLATLNVNSSRTVAAIKSLVPPVLYHAAYQALIVKNIPGKNTYRPHYSPWLEPDFQKLSAEVYGNTCLKPESLYTLLHHLRETLHLEGDALECGVWRGGSAKLLFDMLRGSTKTLHLFDSFEGMAVANDALDQHEAGDFSDTSLDYVRRFVSGGAKTGLAFHKGWIPQSFAGLDDLMFCFAHIDLDLHQSILDALEFIYPRMTPHGVIIFDDYGFASCPGARKAVDDFFANKPETPFVLTTAQAIVVKR